MKIYHFTGFSLNTYEYEIIKETDKTYQVQRGLYPFRLNKKEINRPCYHGEFWSFDKEKIIEHARKAIDEANSRHIQKVNKATAQLKELMK
jgi:hypothetical protein